MDRIDRCYITITETAWIKSKKGVPKFEIHRKVKTSSEGIRTELIVIE
jgi:hypothetical protein